jgi:2-iminobutanoate/2-iminopropanoate deaminase
MQRTRFLPLIAIAIAACTTAQQQPVPAAQAGSPAATATQGAAAAGGDMQFLNSSRILSGAVRVGKTLYLSGQLGSDSTGNYGGITAETRNALEKVKALVERHGSSMDRVAKCTVFLVDMSEWGAMNAVYTTYFPTNRPARSAIGTSLLGGARVEIECIAILP